MNEKHKFYISNGYYIKLSSPGAISAIAFLKSCTFSRLMTIHQLDIIIPLNVVIGPVNHFKKETYLRNTIENTGSISLAYFYGTNGGKLMDNAIKIGIDKQMASFQSVSKYTIHVSSSVYRIKNVMSVSYSRRR